MVILADISYNNTADVSYNNTADVSYNNTADVSYNNINLLNDDPYDYQDFNLELKNDCYKNNIPDYEKKMKNSYYVKYKNEIGPNYSFDNDNDIKLYDNIINPDIINNIYDLKFFDRSLWIQHRGIESCIINCFKCNVYYNQYFKKLFYQYIIPNIDYEDKDKLRISRSYINMYLYGQPGDWHQDGPGLGPTIMVYLNAEWDTKWEGQTAFYINYKNREIKYVDVVPGRIVVLKPYLLHRACDMSAFAKIEGIKRYTLAYHTYFDD